MHLYFGRRKKKTDFGYKVYNKMGIDIDVVDFIKQMWDRGAGEIVLTSVDNDGMMNGFDIQLVSMVESVAALLIVVGGGGEFYHITVGYLLVQK